MSFSMPPENTLSQSSALPSINMQSVMKMVYLWMGMGLGLTALVAAFIAGNTALQEIVYQPGFMIGSMIGTFGLVFALSFGMTRKWLTPTMAMGGFLLYAGLMGVMLSSVAYAAMTSPEAAADVTAALISTVILFGTMTVFGYTTKMDLTKWGTYLFMGLIALILVSIVNVFIGSSAFAFAISIFGVLLFTALTAYDTQRIKTMAESYEVQADGSLAVKVSIMGALMLYLDFINLFLFLLSIFSRD